VKGVSIMPRKKDSSPAITQHQIDALARCFLPAIQKYFESEEGKREFAAWKAKQAKAKRRNTKPSNSQNQMGAAG